MINPNPSSLTFLHPFTKILTPLLRDRLIETDFQPIVSVRRGKIIALEALSRFRDAAGHVSSPIHVFQHAQDAGLRCQLDWLCIDAALRRFASHHQRYADTLVFINVHADTLLNDSGAALHRMASLSKIYGVPHPNIALELLESAVSSSETRALEQIVSQFKRHGFLIALDDLGIENSNMDRIVSVCPDLVKADRSLVEGINKDRYKQSVFQGLAEIAERIGGWLVGEGVETQHDALCALDLGGDLLQGYLFGRPQPIDAISNCFEEMTVPIERVAQAFKRRRLAQTKSDITQREERETIAQIVLESIAGLPRDRVDAALRFAIKSYSNQVESACWLDSDGIQQSETLTNPHPVQPEKTVIYHPPRKGDSHALKEYFYLLMEGTHRPTRFETTPYVPLPTAEICITSTSCFQDAAGETAILCLHLRVSP